MRCPYCKKDDSKVVDCRRCDDGYAFRRRLECKKCGRRWTTYERFLKDLVVVRHRDGKVEEFSRGIVVDRLSRHCAKLPIRDSSRVRETKRLVARLEAKGSAFSTTEIAEEMMEVLGKLHPMARLRFELDWYEPRSAADVLKIVWEFADAQGILQKPKKG